ncbi:MAG: alpha-amylase, partial [Chloroflexi bacterium]|nr:alpha-amylase [Chloroflexota bacterium]
GGAIPSRAEHSLTREQFDERMPEEFWREVVDRVASEAPGTLLLAEAFWMMEGYFVRTLGMHRVYNSAFMNMLRDEENAKYRSVIKNTVEFDPEILKRYVNFLNNPDESTAVAQFGKDDKYFGICMMMVTMPGLPMFGHGQWEGYAEKYGMEYRRAYWDEKPDERLVERHEREISPLLHRRAIFSGVEHFLLYDCFASEGHVHEDVFAYSNRSGDDRGLVVFHNRFAEVQGWIRTSAAFMDRDGDRGLVQRSLGEGLGLTPGEHRFCIFRDHASGLEFIRHCSEVCEKGLFVSLGAYRCQVFLDFREVEDNEWRHYALLAGRLDGRGVPSIHEALREILLGPILEPFAALLHTALPALVPAGGTPVSSEPVSSEPASSDGVGGTVLVGVGRLLAAIKQFTGGSGDETLLAAQTERELAAARGDGPALLQIPDDPAVLGPLYCWIFVHNLGRVAGDEGFEEQSRSWIDEWLLGKAMSGSLRETGLDEGAARRGVLLVKLLTTHQRWYRVEKGELLAAPVLETWLRDEDVRQFLGVNRHGGQLWFNHESFEQLLWWMELVAQIALTTEESAGDTERRLSECARVLQELKAAEAASGYRLDRLLAGG